jgi:hypothetical protein
MTLLLGYDCTEFFLFSGLHSGTDIHLSHVLVKIVNEVMKVMKIINLIIKILQLE